ncbi:MAG: hypothetical protein WA807_01405 [Steroidobacteraceae bacterium]
MRYFTSVFVLGVTTLGALSGCGGGSGGYYGGGGGPPPLVSYVGTAGVFVAWADPISGNFAAAPIGSYAGKKQVMRGTVDFQTGTNLSQPAGIEVYKGSDGHIYGLNLAAIGMPAGEQLSSEAAATVDDTCTLPGTQVAGADYDYIGVYFAADLQTTTNSSYIYRLPGPDGVCNSADDIFHMVKTGMASTDAPIIVSGMPVATVRTAQGGISGFVVKSGATLQLVDSNFANAAVLGTFAAPIGVAVALPVGTTQGYPTGQLYLVDGNIVYVNYAARTVSGTLYSIPNWIPTNPEALFAASPTTLYFSVNTPAVGVTPAHATLFAMPADGSAMPSALDTEPGRIATLLFPVQGADLLWGVVNSTYAIRTLPAAGGASTTLVNSAENDGTFIATASTIYYETWAQSFDAATNTLTRSGTQSGIVGVNGSLIQAPLANSTFVNGGQQLPWPDDTTTTATAYQTLFQVQGLSPVTVTHTITGEIYVEDGVSGGTLIAIDAGSNQPVTTIGQLPVSTATTLNGTFRDVSNTVFLEAENALSTQDPATRDLYLFDSQATDSLSLLTNNL